MTKKSKLKTKLHFNRVNMQRGLSTVWTALNSRGCFGAERLVIIHDGKVIATTVFDPQARQAASKHEEGNKAVHLRER